MMRTEETNTVLPFERAAMRNQELPEGLSLADINAFYALRDLYKLYYAGGIDREQATREKINITRAYERAKSREESYAEVIQLWKHIAGPARAYAKEPTRATADAFYAAVYGLPSDWRNERNKEMVKGVPWEDDDDKRLAEQGD